MPNKKFPKTFLFGAATSSYQIEGGNFKSDWYLWEKEKGLEQCGEACDSYNRYEGDFGLAKELNQNAHRFSIEWSRINPEEGVFDQKEIEHYRKVIRALKKRGIEPFVTLHHFTLPIWVSKKGGWGKRKTINYFTRYVRYVIKELGEEAKFWITINEPLVYASCGTIAKIWPPGKGGIWLFQKMFRHLVKAHKKAYREIKKISPDLQIGLAKNNFYYDKKSTKNPFKILFAHFAHFLWNVLFLKLIKKKLDFIGLNHYNYIDLNSSLKKPEKIHLPDQNDHKLISDIGWEIYPPSIYHCLKKLKKYHLPIYITENGVADTRDKLRKKFIHDYLEQILKAINQGVNVKGYFYWSLLDNFEWADGFKMKFGLIEVDYETQKRTVRESARYYAEVSKQGKLVDL